MRISSHFLDNIYMKRKLIVALFAIFFILSGLSASDWSFFVDGLDQHPEFVWGFPPTYLSGGVRYTGLDLLPEDTTTIQMRVGGGYIERKFWKNFETGADDLEMTPLTYDIGVFEWGAAFSQGFLDSPAGDKDFITLTLGYEGRYEKALDGYGGRRPVAARLATNFDQINSHNVYNDIKGDSQYLGTNFTFTFKLDGMYDDIETNDGYLVSFDADWSPLALNSALDGFADYYQFTLNAVGAKTLYQYKTGDTHWISITLIDRVRLNWLDGSYVPGYVQKLGSLGRLVRGYTNYTYGSNFTIVNNLEFRFAGPAMGVKGLHPRINLFFDMGYGCGNFYNSSVGMNSFIASTGAQIEISIFDFIDIGVELAYLIGGVNYAKPDSNFSFGFTFFLDY